MYGRCPRCKLGDGESASRELPVDPQVRTSPDVQLQLLVVRQLRTSRWSPRTIPKLVGSAYCSSSTVNGPGRIHTILHRFHSIHTATAQPEKDDQSDQPDHTKKNQNPHARQDHHKWAHPGRHKHGG